MGAPWRPRRPARRNGDIWSGLTPGSPTIGNHAAPLNRAIHPSPPLAPAIHPLAKSTRQARSPACWVFFFLFKSRPLITRLQRKEEREREREGEEIKAERKGSPHPGDVCFPLEWKLNGRERWSSANAGREREERSPVFEQLSWIRLRVHLAPDRICCSSRH